MNLHDAEHWEEALSEQQREQLAWLRGRRCRVEAVFIPAADHKPAATRFDVTADHILLASVRAEDDLSLAFDRVFDEARHKLRLS